MLTEVLDHGIVELVSTMGTDQDVIDAARVSYGAGTKSVRDGRGLIRYLMRHQHTSPFEMPQMRFYLKMPIFVARQWVRHRTAKLNEYSGRYSEMSPDFYIPDLDKIAVQSAANKQGRGDILSEEYAEITRKRISDVCHDAYADYQVMIDAENFPFGVARELARTVLPVGFYTEMVWQMDLKNLLHFLKLRMDSHAQYEIRVFADAIAEMVKEQFPIIWEAFEDYQLNAVTFSAPELELLAIVLRGGTIDLNGDEPQGRLSKGEVAEFREKMRKVANIGLI